MSVCPQTFSFLKVASLMGVSPFCAACHVQCIVDCSHIGLTHLLHSELHWLDVPQRILHELGVTVHRCLQGRAPQYLLNCCHPTSGVASRQRLRSSSGRHLVVPRHRRSTLGRRAGGGMSLGGEGELSGWGIVRGDCPGGKCPTLRI